ncbi:MAG: preprotein translocase subunit SecG [Crocinitomicaceae bacterium]|nr:preprotein translocase subunit SecG [Crocinitomicaceae bacterium]
MELLFTILIIIGCVGIILFILVQNPKGGGLNTEFGSAVQLGGAKRATDILEKGTWGMAIAIAAICLFMAIGQDTGVANPGDQLEEFDTNAEEIIPGSEETGGGTAPVQMPPVEG